MPSSQAAHGRSSPTVMNSTTLLGTLPAEVINRIILININNRIIFISMINLIILINRIILIILTIMVIIISRVIMIILIICIILIILLIMMTHRNQVNEYLDRLREHTVTKLWEMTEKMNILYPANWTRLVIYLMRQR